MSKLISLNKQAYEVLLWAKLKAYRDGYENMTHSGTVLWLKEKIEQMEKEKNENK